MLARLFLSLETVVDATERALPPSFLMIVRVIEGTLVGAAPASVAILIGVLRLEPAWWHALLIAWLWLGAAAAIVSSVAVGPVRARPSMQDVAFSVVGMMSLASAGFAVWAADSGRLVLLLLVVATALTAGLTLGRGQVATSISLPGALLADITGAIALGRGGAAVLAVMCGYVNSAVRGTGRITRRALPNDDRALEILARSTTALGFFTVLTVDSVIWLSVVAVPIAFAGPFRLVWLAIGK